MPSIDAARSENRPVIGFSTMTRSRVPEVAEPPSCRCRSDIGPTTNGRKRTIGGIEQGQRPAGRRTGVAQTGACVRRPPKRPELSICGCLPNRTRSERSKLAGRDGTPCPGARSRAFQHSSIPISLLARHHQVPSWNRVWNRVASGGPGMAYDPAEHGRRANAWLYGLGTVWDQVEIWLT